MDFKFNIEPERLDFHQFSTNVFVLPLMLKFNASVTYVKWGLIVSTIGPQSSVINK